VIASAGLLLAVSTPLAQAALISQARDLATNAQVGCAAWPYPKIVSAAAQAKALLEASRWLECHPPAGGMTRFRQLKKSFAGGLCGR
jgi:hypothetical protein